MMNDNIFPTSYEDTNVISNHDQQSMTGSNTSTQQSMPGLNTLTQQSMTDFNTPTQQSMTGFNTSTQQSETGSNTLTQQSMTDFNISTQLYPVSSHIPQYNDPPPSNSSFNLLNANSPQSGIFRFDIPGFKIIVIPVTPSIENLNVQDVGFYLDDSSSNITNNPQTRFQ